MAPLNETLGSYSELFMLLATATYVVAFLAFAWDMATSGRTARRDAPGPADAEPATAPALAAAGGGGKQPGRNRPAPPAAPGPAAPGNGLGYAGRRNPARVGVALSILGAAIHAAGVITRGIAAGRVPWGNMYEFCTTGAFLVVAVFLLALARRDLRFLGTFVLGLALVMMTAGAVAFWTPVGHLVPALQSYWLVIHVSIAVLSSALFTLTFCLSVLQLIQARHEARTPAGADRGGFLALVPPAEALEALAYRINTIGFVTWSLTLLFGAMWAEKAWGRFWGWDPKEVWTFIIWVVYAAYLHARATRGWTGTRAAWLSITGYLCVVFNFTVVNVFINGLHSYAGLPS